MPRLRPNTDSQLHSHHHRLAVFTCLITVYSSSCYIYITVLTCEAPSKLCDVGSMKYCLEVHKLCDEKIDCPDGSDEGQQCGKYYCMHKITVYTVCLQRLHVFKDHMI